MRKHAGKLKETVASVYNRSKPTPDIIEKRKFIFELVQTLIVQSTDSTPEYSIFGPIKILTYGSINAGLDTTCSDIDICVNFFDFCGEAETIKSHSSKILNEIADILITDSVFAANCSIEKRTEARVKVPVLKVKMSRLGSRSGISLDISIENTNALKKTRLLCACGEIDPRFRTLVSLVKYWANRRQINDAASKTMNSFAYTLGVIQFLQTRTPPILPCLSSLSAAKHVSLIEYSSICSEFEAKNNGFGDQNSQTTEELLVQFMFFMLEICSETNSRKCISVGHGMLKPVAECKFKQGSLCIEDIFDPSINVARSVTPDDSSFFLIQSEFSRACELLEETGDFTVVCRSSQKRNAS